MVYPPVSAHPVDKPLRRDVEENVHQNNKRNRGEKYRYSEPADRFLILENADVLFVAFRTIEEEVGKYGDGSHGRCCAPRVSRVPAILAPIGDSQEDIAGAECPPDVVAHTVQPEEGPQQADVEERVGDDEANVVAELGKYPNEVRRLADDKAHRDRGHYVSHEISGKEKWTTF